MGPGRLSERHCLLFFRAKTNARADRTLRPQMHPRQIKTRVTAQNDCCVAVRLHLAEVANLALLPM